jgi:ATP-dependent Clp protease protease subunit
MAVVINLTGEIGWQIRPKNVAEQLSRVGDQDVIVRLSTIGGDVFDGADIVNLFLDYRRDNPNKRMTLEIKAIAASYGSALMSSGIWDEIGISRVSAFMMHRASTFAYANAEELKEVVKFLEGLDGAYSSMYSDQSGKSIAEIIELMTKETWYFGQQIIDEGFADRIITMDDEGGEPLPDSIDDQQINIYLTDFKAKREALLKNRPRRPRMSDLTSKEQQPV